MRKKVLITLLIVTAGVFIYSRGNNIGQDVLRDPGEKEDAAPGLEQKVVSFKIDGRSPKGAKQWNLEGDSAEIIGDDIHLKSLRAMAFGDTAAVSLSSEKGVYRKDKGEVELIGDVEVISDDGVVLTTDKARWSQEKREITTDSHVDIEKKGFRASGDGGMANSGNKTALLRSNVSVKIEPFTLVMCDGPLEIDYDKKQAIFHDNVGVEDKDGKLFADMLTVYFDKDTEKISQVVAEGNVRVKKGKSYTISEKAIYTDSTKSAKLLGRPRVIIDPEQIDQLDSLDIRKTMSIE
ncbi:MAG: LPS export ABC transporter periplasmic protein LptC [Candidatus Omnitrophica bacterium]|nr:LPS export ABC transporter periplasmic protein LptC [Candidatus Omnitrophota bacterium]MDD5487600.1 LPS export ABC transporter periplasmic protein LptC [Candidatus Omnitrophota bacterium]